MASSSRRLTHAVPAGALAIGLALGLLAPLLLPQPGLPPSRLHPLESYVGVLVGPEGRTGLVVSARRDARELEVRHVVPVGLPRGQSLALWQIDAAGVAQPLGRLGTGPSTRLALREPAQRQLATAVAFGVTLEREGHHPQRPSGPYVYQGACGALWRADAASARRASR